MSEVIFVNFKTRQVVSREDSQPEAAMMDSSGEMEDLEPQVIGEDENFVYVSDCGGFVTSIPKHRPIA